MCRAAGPLLTPQGHAACPDEHQSSRRNLQITRTTARPLLQACCILHVLVLIVVDKVYLQSLVAPDSQQLAALRRLLEHVQN